MKTTFLLIDRVRIGSFEHLIPIVLALCLAVGLIQIAKRKCSKIQQVRIFHALACFVSATIIVFNIYLLGKGQYNVQTDLPLYLCSFMALIVPVYTYYRKYWMYEILLFWVIAGTSQGVITPDIAEGFPSFDYFRYWIVHLGLLTIMFYATFVFNERPKFRSLFRSILALQLYVGIIIVMNYLLDANYIYLNQKPNSSSLLDYLGDWPYYIIVVQLFLIPYFILIYLPFYIEEKRKLLRK